MERSFHAGLLAYFDAAPDAIIVVDATGHLTAANPGATRLFARTVDALAGRPVKEILPDFWLGKGADASGGTPPRAEADVAPPSRAGGARLHPNAPEQTALRGDGTTVPVELSTTRIPAAEAGEEPVTLVVIRDITERKREVAEQARLASIVRASHDAVIGKTITGIITDWNPGATRLYGYEAHEIIGRHASLLFPGPRQSEEEAILAMVAGGELVEHYRTEQVRKDGTPVKVSLTISPIISGGRVTGIGMISRIITQAELAATTNLGLLEAAPDAIVATDTDGRIVYANARSERILGYPRNELLGQIVEILVPEDRRERHVGHRGRYLTRPVNRPMGAGQQLMARRKNGSQFPADISLSTVDTADGRLVVTAIRDATERLAVQGERDRLKAVAEQERLARRLQQTQRMESLGQLAGGVAHDFNNLLAVIVNYSAFVAEEVSLAAETDEQRWQPVAKDIEQIRSAAERGITLTHQLLAFGHREVTRPRVLSLNTVIADFRRVLGRSLGEHIELREELSAELWPVRADPAQLEQVLVNLAVNARDAMPGGGAITMATDNFVITEPGANVLPGRYVRLRVTDTGVGMPPEVAARAFEPFFTTKAKGEGSGLGLATVYGIITGAAGDVQISTALGRGTCFTLLLPASDERAVEPEEPRRFRPAEEQEEGARGHGETILICEDEPAIGEVTRRILARHGYQVIVAKDGIDAIRHARQHEGPVNLLLTDVVMPQVLGKDVATAVRNSRPETKVLYMSGYARPTLSGTGTLEPGAALLEKPFSEEMLLVAVRDVLDS